MHLDKQHYKSQNIKICLNAIPTALTMLYLHSNKPNAAKFVHWTFLKILNEITFSFANQPLEAFLSKYHERRTELEALQVNSQFKELTGEEWNTTKEHADTIQAAL